jgi:hypothetical protein
MNTAGILIIPETVVPSDNVAVSKGDIVKDGGKSMPKLCKIFTKYLDHDMATVAAPTAYSSTKSQPIIQAINLPMVT